MKEAAYYQREDAKIRCQLCPQHCLIAPEAKGLCRVRRHQQGRLIAENYGYCAAMAIDPIEKKPLYHFYPGRQILSVGTKGCNLKCRHCQNWSIAHCEPEMEYVAPAVLAQLAAEKQQEFGNLGLAYTYSEPSVWYEFVLDTAQELKLKGLKNVLITNAFMETQPWQELLPLIDAMNIDIKGFTEEFYREVCTGGLDTVLRNTKEAASQCHVEITTLIIPGLNDAPEEIAELSQWMKRDLGADTPLHLTRYFPNYQMRQAPTPIETLTELGQIASQHLNYVYLGNVVGKGSNSYCPQCHSCVIDRSSGTTQLSGLILPNTCKYCGAKIYLIN